MFLHAPCQIKPLFILAAIYADQNAGNDTAVPVVRMTLMIEKVR